MSETAAVKDSSIDMTFDEQQRQYVSKTEISTVQKIESASSAFDQPNLINLMRDHGWKYTLVNYFPHYTYKGTGTYFYV
jgi:hypothetical protein